MGSNYLKLVKYAFATRFTYILLSAVSNLLIPDHEADAFKGAGRFYEEFASEHGFFWILFGGLQHWDVQHYLHIAQFGYTYENNLAFFPLYPCLLTFFSSYFKMLLPVLNPMLLILIVGVLLNLFFFTKATIALYDLTLLVFKNEDFAFRTAVIFCMSPASIFFVAPYTESLFSFLVFRGLIGFAKHDFKKAAFWFCISTCARSNGMTYIIFFAHAYTYYFQELFDTKFIISPPNFDLATNFLKSMVKVCLIISTPYILFQTYGYYVFCIKKNSKFSDLILTYAEMFNLTMPSSYIDWCGQNVPFNYFTIQKKYWNVGFLNYFSLKQIPNFLLALPMILIILNAGYHHIKKNYKYMFKLKPVYDSVPDIGSPDLPAVILPYVLHAIILTVWAFFTINVQVLTRLLSSSSPLLYWIVAHHCFLLKNKSDSSMLFQPPEKSFLQHLMDKVPFEGKRYPVLSTVLYKLYFLSYTIVGIILFSNGYPWT